MTPQTPQNAPEAPESPAKWVSVAEAAAARRVSIRTVKRWIENGEVESRKDGGQRLVSLPDSASDSSGKRDTPEGTKGTQQKGHAADFVSLHAQKEGHKGHSKGTQSERPVSLLALSGADSGTHSSAGAAVSASEREAELLRDSLASEREQNAFLRATIEQLQRDGAETRAALREALKLAPKALTAGKSAGTDAGASFEKLQQVATENGGAALGELEQVGTGFERAISGQNGTGSAPEAPISSDKRAGGHRDGAAAKRPEMAAETGEFSSYGALADWLENSL